MLLKLSTQFFGTKVLSRVIFSYPAYESLLSRFKSRIINYINCVTCSQYERERFGCSLYTHGHTLTAKTAVEYFNIHLSSAQIQNMFAYNFYQLAFFYLWLYLFLNFFWYVFPTISVLFPTSSYQISVNLLRSRLFYALNWYRMLRNSFQCCIGPFNTATL